MEDNGYLQGEIANLESKRTWLDLCGELERQSCLWNSSGPYSTGNQ